MALFTSWPELEASLDTPCAEEALDTLDTEAVRRLAAIGDQLEAAWFPTDLPEESRERLQALLVPVHFNAAAELTGSVILALDRHKFAMPDLPGVEFEKIRAAQEALRERAIAYRSDLGLVALRRDPGMGLLERFRDLEVDEDKGALLTELREWSETQASPHPFLKRIALDVQDRETEQ